MLFIIFGKSFFLTHPSMTSWGWAGPSLFDLVEIGLRRVEISYSKCLSVFLKQRSARVLKKSRSRQFSPSLGKSQSRKTLNWSLGKVSVSIDLNMFSLKKSQRNRKFESRKILSLDNFHWQSRRLLSSEKQNLEGNFLDSGSGLWQLNSSLNLGWWLMLDLFHLIIKPFLTHVIWSIVSPNRIVFVNCNTAVNVIVLSRFGIWCLIVKFNLLCI